MTGWQDIRKSIRNCRICQGAQGVVFAPFNDEHWPVLPEPRQNAILFISEAPPLDGGFWTIQPLSAKQDDLREKLFRLLKLSSSGEDRGLTAFCSAGYYLLQSFPRPLKSSIGNIGIQTLKRLLDHQVKTHLRDQIKFLQPSAILALGVPASTAVSMLWPDSKFAREFKGGGYKLKPVRDRIFEELNLPILAATYLPSGNGWRWEKFWKPDIPYFVRRARSQA